MNKALNCFVVSDTGLIQGRSILLSKNKTAIYKTVLSKLLEVTIFLFSNFLLFASLMDKWSLLKKFCGNSSYRRKCWAKVDNSIEISQAWSNLSLIEFEFEFEIVQLSLISLEIELKKSSVFDFCTNTELNQAQSWDWIWLTSISRHSIDYARGLVHHHSDSSLEGLLFRTIHLHPSVLQLRVIL